ncbi:MAG: DUF4139 domain-containing protein [Planctomycetota bacterium]|nr:DUF4139 domain-containing protein [Planctomycetota bacterium]MEE2895486.1 DUF4139 domain-containing protein [Planctomycetota bacterium]
MTIPSLVAAALLAAGSSADQPATSITIYSSADPAGFDPTRYVAQQRNGFTPNAAWQVPGFGVVKQLRSFELEPGRNQVSFTDVAAFLDPTTVGFTDLTDPGTSVLEQSFQFDLVSPSKLFEKYLDRPIKARVPMGTNQRVVEGTLLSATQGRLVIQADQGIEIVDADTAQVSLTELPDGFLTRPTLVWDLLADRGGEHRIRTTYQTAGLTWRADYNLVLNEDDTEADLTAWVTLLNLSGVAYPDTQLKLVAGDVQRIQPRPQNFGVRARGGAMEMMADGAAGFEEQSFFEYHLYTLPRPTDIASNSTQQLTLFPSVSGAKVVKELVYEPTGRTGFGNDPYTNRGFVTSGPGKIGAFVAFRNTEENRLGMPMPKGRIRAYKQDPKDGTLEFIGEDLIDHTPRNETVRIKLGDSFDVVGDRKVIDFKVDSNRRTMTETVEIEVRNQKKVVQNVVVREHLYRWRNWEIVERNEPFEKVDSNTVEWNLRIAPEATGRIRYEVVYTW